MVESASVLSREILTLHTKYTHMLAVSYSVLVQEDLW